MLYYLSRGHEKLYNTKEPLPYATHKLTTNKLLDTTKTNVKYYTHGHREVDIDVSKFKILRDEVLGDYIEWILPTSITNNVLTPRPLLKTSRIILLKKSIKKYGILTPPLVYVVPKNVCHFKPNYPELQFTVGEGRHRALAAELVGYTKPIPAFVLISKGDIDGYKRLRHSCNNAYGT